MELNKRTLHPHPVLEEFGIKPSERREYIAAESNSSVTQTNTGYPATGRNRPTKSYAWIIIVVVIAAVVVILVAYPKNPDIENESVAMVSEVNGTVSEEESSPESSTREASVKEAETQTTSSAVSETSGDPEEYTERLREIRRSIPGEWEDSYSQRAGMMITPTDDESLYQVRVHWGSSAFETSVWTFSGRFDLETDTITYEDCRHTNEIVSETGEKSEEILYENGTGMIILKDGCFLWTDDMENAGENCVFEKYTEQVTYTSDVIRETAENVWEYYSSQNEEYDKLYVGFYEDSIGTIAGFEFCQSSGSFIQFDYHDGRVSIERDPSGMEICRWLEDGWTCLLRRSGDDLIIEADGESFTLAASQDIETYVKIHDSLVAMNEA